MSRRDDNKRASTGSAETNLADNKRGNYYGNGDRSVNEGGRGGRSFSRGGYYGGGDGRGRRGVYRSYRGGRGFRGGNQNRTSYKRNQGHQDIGGKRQRMEVGNRLKEVDIGVTEFIGDHKGISGVVKERWADFHVHEITLNGEIAKLTDQSIPPEPEHLADMEDLKKEIPPEVWEQLESLIEADNMVTSVDIDVTTMNKDQRRAIHTIAKKIPKTISQTVEKGDTKLIVVAKSNKQKQSGYKFRRDQRVDWSSRGGNYCHFLLHKVNMDTMDALNQLAMSLRVKSNMFDYAGTKDRRARTTQWVSVKKVSPSDILAAAKTIRGAYVGNFKFCEEPLRLGMLSGNRFRIALKSVTESDEDIEKAMTSLRDHGFINYYGLQRFGTVAAIPTHEIGRALLQGKWHEAIELILKPRAGEQQRDLIEAREVYRTTKDAHAAYQKIERPDKIEAKLLWGLHVCGENNPQGALDWVPRNTNLMYIHAYQSLIWNMMVSKRIKELGLKPVVGDLVYENRNFKEETEKLEYIQNDEEEGAGDKKEDKVQPKESSQEKDSEAGEDIKQVTENPEESLEVKECESKVKETVIDEKEKIKAKVEEVMDTNAVTNTETNSSVTKDVETDPVAKDTIEEEKSNAEIEKEDLRSLPDVKVLTENDLSNYTISDVVMPQAGWKVTYPTYAKPWFDEVLAKDDLTTDLRQKNKKYTLGGAYRKMLEVPSDITWRVMHYKDRNEPLILCDVDEMRGQPAPKEDPEGKHKALIVEMSLRSSTYATMALREILKCDTSPETQAAQSAANKAQEDQEERKVLNDETEQKSSETEEKEDNKDSVADNETKMEVVNEVVTKTETESMDVVEEKVNRDDQEETKTLMMETESTEAETAVTEP